MALVNIYTAQERQTYIRQAQMALRNVSRLIGNQENHFNNSVEINLQPYGDSFLTGQIEDQGQSILELLENVTKILNTDSLQRYKWSLVAGSNDRLDKLKIEADGSNWTVGFKDWDDNPSSVLYWVGVGDELMVEIPSESLKAVATVISVDTTTTQTATVSGLAVAYEDSWSKATLSLHKKSI